MEIEELIVVCNVAIEVNKLLFVLNHRYLSSFMAGVTYNYLTTSVSMLQLRRIEGASNCEDVFTAQSTLDDGTNAKIAATIRGCVIMYDSLLIVTIKNQNNYPNGYDLVSGTMVFFR